MGYHTYNSEADAVIADENSGDEIFMTTSRLELPFGYIQLLLNGKPIEFEYEKSEYVSYWDENDIEIKPLGAISISIYTDNYNVNDELYIFCSAGGLVSDGGDEYAVNEVAELEEYTYGIGGPDTEYLEWTLGNIPNDVPDSSMCGYTKREVALELVDMTSNGLKYIVVEALKSEVSYLAFSIPIVWEINSKPYAYNIVSCLTC